jgi:hypothetical protein
MSGNSRKRTAEVSTKEPTSKRANTDIISLDSSPEPEVEKAISNKMTMDTKAKNDRPIYNIIVELHSAYNVFPESLRVHLQKLTQSTIGILMRSASNDTAPPFKYRYSVVSKRSVRNSDTTEKPNITLCKGNIASISIANTTLLEIFTQTWKTLLAKPGFVYLKKEDGLSNPDFTRLHAPRTGEIGWGFDTNDCLSFYILTRKDNKLNEYVIYVQRAEMKVATVEKHEN